MGQMLAKSAQHVKGNCRSLRVVHKAMPHTMDDMDVSEIRRVNLLALIGEQRLSVFCRDHRLNEKYVRQVKSQYRKCGHALAREIEIATGHPHGWMDVQHTVSGDSDFEERMIWAYRNSDELRRSNIRIAVEIALEWLEAQKNHTIKKAS